MRIGKNIWNKYVYLIGILGTLITVSTVSAIFQLENRAFVSGDDCLDAHSTNFIYSEIKLNYDGYANIGEELSFELSFNGYLSGTLFSATSEIIIDDPNINLHEGQTSQSKLVRTEDDFTALWSLSGNQNGTYTFKIKTEITVQYIRFHPTYVATYEYTHTGSFVVQEGSETPPVLFNTDESPDNGEPLEDKYSFKYLIGQLLGFLSIITVYIGIQLGMPERKQWMRKKLECSGAKIRQLHCNWGYFSVATIGLHLIFLSQTRSWGNYIRWYDIFPKFLSLRILWSPLFIGLDLAAFSGGIFLITTIAGRFFKPIAQKYGYRSAVLTQQISYLALILGILHSIINGTWTGESLLLIILQVGLLLEVIISRIYFYIKKRKKNSKAERAK